MPVVLAVLLISVPPTVLSPILIEKVEAATTTPEIEKIELTSTTTIAAYIEQRAAEEGVATSTALAIAECESQFVWNAKNPHSTASGPFQWIRSSWRFYSLKYFGTTTRSVFDPKDNIDLAIHVLKTRGTSDWNESKRCWYPKLDM